MPRIVMKFGGTSMAGIERIRSVRSASNVRPRSTMRFWSSFPRWPARPIDWCSFAARPPRCTTRPNMTWWWRAASRLPPGSWAMTLQGLGLKARSFMGWQLVRASGVHGNARVEAVEVPFAQRIPERGTVAVIPGFQGVCRRGRVATLGRGGSDTSAVAIAAAVKADRCDIYTDVDGVYTTDPRIVPEGAQTRQVTFEEMLELAGVGAKVLQVRSVGLAMREHSPLRVLSAFEDRPGTDIVGELSGAHMERNVIAGIAADRNEARLTLTRRARQARHGGAGDRPGCRGGHPDRHDRPCGDSEQPPRPI